MLDKNTIPSVVIEPGTYGAIEIAQQGNYYLLSHSGVQWNVYNKIYNIPPRIENDIIDEPKNVFKNKTCYAGVDILTIDNLGNVSFRDFNIKIKNPNPIWVTPTYYELNGKVITNTSVYNNNDIINNLAYFYVNEIIKLSIPLMYEYFYTQPYNTAIVTVYDKTTLFNAFIAIEKDSKLFEKGFSINK